MKQDNFKWMGKVKGCFHAVLIVMLALCISSCESDSDEAYDVKMGITDTDVLTGEKIDALIERDYIWNTSKSGEVKSFFLYSNLPAWMVQSEVESDVEWIEVWPGEGSRDGRFYVKVYPNSTAEERTSSLHIIHDGVVYWTIPIVQSASN